MGTAVSLLTSAEKQARKTAYQSFQTIILKALEEANIDFSINGEPTNRLAHVLNLHLKGIPSDLLLMHLDLRGIAISTGSAWQNCGSFARVDSDVWRKFLSY